MVTYRAILDVPREAAPFLSRLLATERKLRGTRNQTRALTCFPQAVMALRHFHDGTDAATLARDHGIGRSTGHRYIDEATDVLAEQAPDLHHILRQCREQGMGHVILDGTLIDCDRVAGTNDKGNDVWYSGKAKRFAGSVKFLAAPEGTPLWVCDVEPGSRHDLTCARIHALPALYPAAAQGLPTLADVGYFGAGIGVHTPLRPHPDIPSPLTSDNRAHNRLLRCVRALGERAAAELKQRWRALKHITLSPGRIGAIAQAALVLNNAWK